MLILSTSCGVSKGVSLRILPVEPAREYVFVDCTHAGVIYPCLTPENAAKYVDYLEKVDTYIGMTKSLRIGEVEKYHPQEKSNGN